jgi:hypothetical protein
MSVQHPTSQAVSTESLPLLHDGSHRRLVALHSHLLRVMY